MHFSYVTEVYALGQLPIKSCFMFQHLATKNNQGYHGNWNFITCYFSRPSAPEHAIK